MAGGRVSTIARIEAIMITVKLDTIWAVALEVLAKHEGITPEQLVCDLIRDAAICMVTGRQRQIIQDGIVVKSRDTNV